MELGLDRGGLDLQVVAGLLSAVRTGRRGLGGGDPPLRAARGRVRAPPAADERGGLRRPDRPAAAAVRQRRGAAGRLPAALPLPDGGRVPGHLPPAVPAHPRPGPGAPQPLRGGRRRPVDLLLAGGQLREPARVRAGLPGAAGDQAGAELPLHRPHPAGRQPPHRQQPQPQAQAALDPPGRRGADPAVPGRERGRGGGLHRRADPRPGHQGAGAAERVRGAGAHQRPHPGASRSPSCASASPTRSPGG